MAFIDLTGKTFGERIVLSRAPDRRQNGDGRTYWVVKCSCGTISQVKGEQLRRATRCRRHGDPRLPRGYSGRNLVFRQYKKGAKARRHPFGLSLEEFTILTCSFCRYCGCPPTTEAITKGSGTYEVASAALAHAQYLYNGIDRWDNAIGYTFENCVPCCKTCNFLKGPMNGPEFVAHVQLMAAHLGGHDALGGPTAAAGRNSAGPG